MKLLAAVLVLCSCNPRQDGIPVRASKSRAIIIDEQGLCWKTNRWFSYDNGRTEAYSKMGVLSFAKTSTILILKGNTSWWKAGEMLSTDEKHCTDFTYKEKKR